MNMVILLNFGLALLATLVVSGVAYGIARALTIGSPRVAALAFGCGYAISGYTFVQPLGTDVTVQAAKAAGAVVALVILWFVLFRRRNHAQS
jgi:hypothetical protein